MNGQIGNSVNQIDSISRKSRSIHYMHVYRSFLSRTNGPHKRSEYSSIWKRRKEDDGGNNNTIEEQVSLMI